MVGASFLVIYRSAKFAFSGWQSGSLRTRPAHHPVGANVNYAVSMFAANVHGRVTAKMHRWCAANVHRTPAG
jgi:hypothetical protein